MNELQMMYVGSVCNGYEPIAEGFISCVGAPNSKSCTNCVHLKNNKCDIDLYDKVVTSIDQT